jgi:para-aminobenzoate synthetase
MKTLVIDNYNSFTYNLVHLLAVVNQEEPMVIRNDEVAWAEIRQWRVDNIVISPGPGRPDRARDFGVSRDVILHADVPLLGVCLGHQGMVALAGGTVVRAAMPMHGRTSLIRHAAIEIFDGLPQALEVARYHSLQAARPLPSPLVETAWAEDGSIMAIADRRRRRWGVQFHPESIITDGGRRLMENFRDLSRRAAGPVHAVTPLPPAGKVAARPAASAAVQHSTARRAASRDGSRRKAVWRELPYAVEGDAAFPALFADAPTAFWLDSSLVEPGRSRWSYLGDASGPDAAVVAYRCRDRSLAITGPQRRRHEQEGILAYLGDTLAGPPDAAPPCPFPGGHVGWLGYELRHDCGSPTLRQAATPDALLIRADRFIAVDHLAGRSYVVAIDAPEETAAPPAGSPRPSVVSPI